MSFIVNFRSFFKGLLNLLTLISHGVSSPDCLLSFSQISDGFTFFRKKLNNTVYSTLEEHTDSLNVTRKTNTMHTGC